MNTARKFTLILIFLICAAVLGGLLFLRVTAAPEPTPADDPAYAAALAGAAQLLANEARTAGTYTGKEPFNFAVAALFPSVQVAGGAPQVPTGLLTHQVARF